MIWHSDIHDQTKISEKINAFIGVWMYGAEDI
jgi:hypothetical protein